MTDRFLEYVGFIFLQNDYCKIDYQQKHDDSRI